MDIQTDLLAGLDASIDALLKEPPSRELRTVMFDEGSRTPPPIQAATLLEPMRGYRDVLPDIDVPTLVCAGADETWRSVASVEDAAELLPTHGSNCSRRVGTVPPSRNRTGSTGY